MKRSLKLYHPQQPQALQIADGVIFVVLADGQVLQTFLRDHPWLQNATSEQQENYELGPLSIYWPDLDDGFDIEWLLQNALHTK